MGRTTALKPCTRAARSCCGTGATGTQQSADQPTMGAGVGQRMLPCPLQHPMHAVEHLGSHGNRVSESGEEGGGREQDSRLPPALQS